MPGFTGSKTEVLVDKPAVEIQYDTGNGNWETRDEIALQRILTPTGSRIWKSYRIGRHPENEIVIPWVGSLISRYQATLIRNVSDSDYWVLDGLPSKPSSNGVTVNGVKISGRALLSHGAVIGLSSGLRVNYFNRSPLVDKLSEITLTDGNTEIY